MITNTEIYLTVKNDQTRLVISGELALLREFLTAFVERGEFASPTIYNPAPGPGSEIAAKP